MLHRFYNRYLFPKEAADSVFHIDYDKLWQAGIRGLIFDIDNTLVTFDIPTPPAEIVDLLAGLTKKGFAICLLSNNSERRVRGFGANLDYPHIWRANKPTLGGISRAMKHLGLDKNQVAIIGDQIFTDCFVGNRFGIHTILTAPIAKRDEWTVKLKRLPERIVLRAYTKRGQNHAN
ncbi:MAG: YqeG family HAD IIIA-type phosphatase [Defluviitaleaceae bacterium]|nr:YqeG family HAD IIIA-type phosphatase [Defluviitaleaceae bacterium]